MANAGRHNDTRVLNLMIREGKLIKILPTDHQVVVKIKKNFNELVMSDYITNHSYNGKKYERHSAWDGVNDILIKTNQLRLRHWCFTPLSFS